MLKYKHSSLADPYSLPPFFRPATSPPLVRRRYDLARMIENLQRLLQRPCPAHENVRLSLGHGQALVSFGQVCQLPHIDSERSLCSAGLQGLGRSWEKTVRVVIPGLGDKCVVATVQNTNK
jgi:hypothetical protein